MWVVLLKVRFVNREEALTKAWKFLFHQKLANVTSINLALVLALYFHNTLTKSTKFARYLIIMHLVSWPIAIIFLIGQTRKNQENHFIFPSFGEKLELFLLQHNSRWTLSLYENIYGVFSNHIDKLFFSLG